MSFINIEGRILRGVFQERPNHFLALVKTKDRILTSYLPDPGRLLELLKTETEVILKEVKTKKERKTNYDLIGVITPEGILVSVDSRVPNRLVLEALKNRDIEEFAGYDEIKPEYRYYNSRLDFYLTNQFEKCLLEVKSCTLVKDGIAMFPDAPTKRGKKHLRDLMKAIEEGYRACVLFMIQRNDASSFSPNDETDPEFGNTLRNAASKGVEVYAYSALFCRNKIFLDGKVKVKL